jgi:hypothetical protein
VAELGVGNGSQARTWLDTFTELDRLHGRDYYRRLHYLMGDYSAHALDRARKAVAHHGGKVSTLVLDATRPQQTLAFLRGKRSACISPTSTTTCPPTTWRASAGVPTW